MTLIILKTDRVSIFDSSLQTASPVTIFTCWLNTVEKYSKESTLSLKYCHVDDIGEVVFLVIKYHKLRQKMIISECDYFDFA